MSNHVKNHMKRRKNTGFSKQDCTNLGTIKQVAPKTAYMKAKCAVIGKNLREQRRQRRFSVEELAGHLDLSESYIGLLERGERCPSLKVVYKLCDLYNITPCELLMAEAANKCHDLDVVDDSVDRNTKMQIKAITSLAGTLSTDENDLIIDIMKKLKKVCK